MRSTQLYVVRCSEREEPLSEPMDKFNAELLRDYCNDNQGEDYCLGDHTIEPVEEPGVSYPVWT